MRQLVEDLVEPWDDPEPWGPTMPQDVLEDARSYLAGGPPGRCRVCGCTDDDCRDCVERTGQPCHWVVPNLCSACVTTEGVAVIAAERLRQLVEEGWSPDHDAAHDAGELEAAASCYAAHASDQAHPGADVAATPPQRWPWTDAWWKPHPDPVRNLEKAGALAAAAIDRRQRLLGPPPEGGAEPGEAGVWVERPSAGNPAVVPMALRVYAVDDVDEQHFVAAYGLVDALAVYRECYGELDADYFDQVSVSAFEDDKVLTIGHEHDDEVPAPFRDRADDGTVSATCQEWVQACGRGLLGSTVR